MESIKSLAVMEAGGALVSHSFTPESLQPHEVEVEVISCGVCASDVSMIDNSWGASAYPLVPGHEVIGTVKSIGAQVSNLKAGDTVGVGWLSSSCATCSTCMSGDHQLCGSAQPTIRGRHGGFADRVIADAMWTIPLPKGLDVEASGPLFCGGITVFNPFEQYDIKPTDRVGIVGIGGLGHLALQFARAWGCEVTAFTGSLDKADELKKLGAHHIVNSRDPNAVAELKGQLDFILSTVSVSLPWDVYLSTLAPKGKFVTVGMVPEPMSVSAFSIIPGQKIIGGSNTGSPATIGRMLKFCERHDINAQVEVFDMKDANAAIDRLRSGKARYRVVLKA